MAPSNPHFQIWHHIHNPQPCTFQAPLPVLIFRHLGAGFTNAHISGVVTEAPALMLSKPGPMQPHKVQEICDVALLSTRLSIDLKWPDCCAVVHILQQLNTSAVRNQLAIANTRNHRQQKLFGHTLHPNLT